jgi:hypothetical protein
MDPPTHAGGCAVAGSRRGGGNPLWRLPQRVMVGTSSNEAFWVSPQPVGTVRAAGELAWLGASGKTLWATDALR